MKKIALIFLATTVVASSCSIFKKSSKKEKKETTTKAPADKVAKPVEKASSAGTKAPAATNNSGYKMIASGTDYKIIVDAPGSVYPNYGDHLELHLNTTVDDSVIFDTRTGMDGQPAPIQLQESPFKGDLFEAMKFMTAGDSAQVRVSIDSLLAAGAPEAPWMKKGTGQKLVYNLQLVTVKTQAQKQKEDQEKAAKQGSVDEKLITDYLAANKIKATKTASGLYYVITKQGTGTQATAGKKVVVNYTGKLLNGQKFDSNVDPEFSHVSPFDFVLGAGNVIKGWDEGIALLKKGGKATFFIPSTLAYGAMSPSPKIPAYSVLVFDVELTDVIAQ